VRTREYTRLSGKDRRFIKGQKYTLLAHWENLTLDGRKSLKLLLAANKRLHTAYLLKESFGQLWSYHRAGWARRFFDTGGTGGAAFMMRLQPAALRCRVVSVPCRSATRRRSRTTS
jgi:hypothetical protein